MSYTDEYLALKKKKKEKVVEQLKTGHSFTDEYIAKRVMSEDEDDVAPVTIATTSKKKEEDRKWFDDGAFDDGYQFGDVFKTILGTTTDIAENLGAGILGMGEKALDAIAYVSPLIAQGQFYQNGGAYQPLEVQKSFNDSIDQSKTEMDKFIQKDLYDEEKVAKKIVLGTDKNSVLGEKADALVQSGGQLLATAGLQAVGVPWFLTTGATSFGGQAETALKEGAGYEAAGLSAAVSAGAEILTEKLSGGIKFGGKTLDDVLLKPLTDKIANKTAKVLVNLGVDALGEGTEEVVSGVFSNLGTALYKEEGLEELLFSEEAMDEYLESFIGGAVLGGVSSGVGAIRDSKRIHLTENEQKVVDFEVEKRIADQNLTDKERNKVRNEVVRDMLNGYISTDTIEEVLGGETFKTHTDTIALEKAMQEEYDTLYQMKNGDKSDAQIDRQAELKKQLEDIKQNFNRDQLGDEVMSLVKGDRLSESYNERSRSGQAFQADVSKYDAKQRETIQKAIDSGILNNTNRTHEFVDMIAKITADKGVLFDFTNNEKLKNSGFAVDGKAVNGYVTKDGVTLNIDSAKSLNRVVGHEITHVLEGTELYQTLQNVVTEYAKTKGEYQGRYDALTKLYEGVEGADINAELTADLVGDYLFTDTDFVRNLSVQHRNVFQKIYDEIKYLCKVATAGSKEARELEKVKKAFEQAYKAGGNTQAETKYSLSYTTDNKPVAKIETDIFDGKFEELTESERIKIVKEAIKNFRPGIPVSGRMINVTRKSAEHFTNSDYTDKIRNNDPKLYEDKLSIAQNMDDVVYASTDYINEDLKHTRKDNITQFARGNVLLEIGGKQYKANVLVGYTTMQEMVLYDVQDLAETAFETKEKKAPPKLAGNNSDTRKTDVLSDTSLTENGKNVKYSLSDSDGKQLSKEQQEYFKDSKVRDENGNLKVVYHGSPADFNTFSLDYLGTNGTAEGYGFYFTDKKSIAENYSRGREGQQNGERGKLFEVYLNIKKPLSDTKVTMTRAQFKKFLTTLNKQVDEDGDPLDVLSNYGDVAWEGLNNVLNYAMEVEYDGSDSDVNLVHSIINGCGNLEVVLDVLRKTTGYDGIIVDNATWGEDQKIYLAFHPEQIKNVDNLNPTSDPDIRRSLSNVGEAPKTYGNYNVRGKDIALETAPVEEVAPVQETVAENATVDENLFPDDDYAPIADDPERFNSLDDGDVPPERVIETGERTDPVKMPKNTVSMIAENVRNSLWVENNQMGDVRRIVEEYAMQEFPDKNWLFQQLKDNYGTHTEKTVDEEVQEVKAALRKYRLNVSDAIKGDIADYNDLRRHNFGKVLFSRQGTDVDVAYEELGTMYPGFFPPDITNPTDQLLQIINVANMDAATEHTYNLEDEIVWDVVEDVAETISDYQHIQTERNAGKPMPKEAFDDLVQNADAYAPARPPQQSEFDVPVGKNVKADTYDTQSGQQTMFKDEPKQQTEEERKQTRKQLHQGIVDNVKATFKAKGFDFDKVLKNAKNLSTFSTVDNMPQRVMEKALGYNEGQMLSDLTVNKVAQNETDGIKWLNGQIETIKKISKQHGIKPGSKASAAAQMYAEGFYVAENNDIIAYGDAELAKDFPDIKVQQNIKALANDPRIRHIYDDTLAMINASRTRNAYPEIPRLDNYFLHFRAMDDTFSKLGLPFNPNDIRAKDLPTDLNGVTADLKPGQPYFASAMHRTGKRTSFDLLGGLERYLNSAKNQIYHIDDIQTLRALRNYIADTYGQANGLEGLDVLSEEEAQERIEKVYNSHLSTFAKFLNEEANVLAGKTALIDRGLEGIIGRRGITFLNTVNGQVGSNMVGFNISSSLTNFLPVAQTLAKTNKFDFVKAFSQTVANKLSGGRFDTFAEDSPVVIRRKGSDRFYRTPWQKLGDVGYVFMSAVDDISTEMIARTKYNELTRKGMDAQKAHYETDKWVSRLMGDRSLGQMPQLYNSKMLGLVTKFQLEVRNQLDSQFYDTIQDAKVSTEHIENRLARNAKMAAKVTSTLTQLALAQHLFGKAFESVAGYNPAFDIISVLMTAFGYDDDEDSEDTVLDNVEQAFLELLEDLPYTSVFTDGGRIPISSALPIGELINGVDEWGNEKSRWKTLGEIAPYYLMPGGYGQAKKTKAGLEMFSDDHPIAGSYTDSGNLRFPVEDNLKNRVQAGIFGQWSSENARDYFDNERSPLTEKKTQEFKALDISIQDYWAYQDEAKKISDRAEIEGASDKDVLKSKYLNSVNDELAELIKEKQKIMDDPSLSSNTKQLRIKPIQQRFDELAKESYASYNNVKIDGDYANIGDRYFQWYTSEEGKPYWRKLTEEQTTKYLVTSSAGKNAHYATNGNVHYRRDEDGEWTKIRDKQLERQNEVTRELGITPEEYWRETEISFMPMSDGKYEYAYDNPENYAVAKAVGGYDAYRGYSKDLYDIKADKDENGKSISGSRKEKVLDYINNLDADYYTKIILWKSEYNSDDTYNEEIIDYLNGRDDISFEETIAILRKLGFDVTDDGDISW